MFDFFSQTNCLVNGETVPCEQLNDSTGMIFWIIFVPLLAVLIAGLVFSFLMFMHAMHSDNPDRKLWLVVIAVSFGLGALAYFYLVKKNDTKTAKPIQFEAKPQDGTVEAEKTTSPLDVKTTSPLSNSNNSKEDHAEHSNNGQNP